jgi:SAM-dependent methyltransferase
MVTEMSLGHGQMTYAGRLRRQAARLLFERGDLEDTYGAVDLGSLGLGHPDRVEYQASSWRLLRRALRGYRIGRTDAFLDYGCGKGRIVYQAARMPFGRVIGVEISAELIEVARRNARRNRQRLSCGDIELVCGDATAYEVPDDVTYVYMYNPFIGDAFRQVLQRIETSLDRRPRPIRLIYVHPVMEAELRRGNRWRLVRLQRLGHERIVVYETAPRSEPA